MMTSSVATTNSVSELKTKIETRQARVAIIGLGYVGLPLALADPNFYHLDTAFCALPSGDVLYYPAAFTAAALKIIHAHVAPAQRIALSRADAVRFAANAVCIDRIIVMSSFSDALRRTLEGRGYTVAKIPLQAFLRSGGSACCLTLRLDHAVEADETVAQIAPTASSMTAA